VTSSKKPRASRPDSPTDSPWDRDPSINFAFRDAEGFGGCMAELAGGMLILDSTVWCRLGVMVVLATKKKTVKMADGQI